MREPSIASLTKEEEPRCCTGVAGKAQGAKNGFPEDGVSMQALHGGHDHAAEYVIRARARCQPG